MGVPGFFAWLLKKYKKNNIIQPNITHDIDTLYIDANCLFHPQCQKVLSYYLNSLDTPTLESQMISRILNFIDYLIGFVNPKKRVYLAVDGVAPRAKINQQRKRRYKAANENNKRDGIKKKHNREIIDKWTNTAITPGTEFMEKLHEKLLNHLKHVKSHSMPNIEFVYSSYHTPGEGEHKLLDDIRKLSPDDTSNMVIYGLDADLMFLAMASGRPNIYLLREDITPAGSGHGNQPEMIDILMDVSEDLSYVSVDLTKEHIDIYIREKIETENNFVDPGISFINDFIVCCFLLGNDFIPSLPSLNIKNNGIDYLLDQYVKTYAKLDSGLVVVKDKDHTHTLNMEFLHMLLNLIALNEQDYFENQYPKYIARLQYHKPQSSDPYEVAIWNMENMRDIKIRDPIRLGKGSPTDWKYRYHNHYHNISTYYDNYINAISQEYIRGILWTLDYYFKSCGSVSWQYPYYCAPFASDILLYLNANPGLILSSINPHDPVDNILVSPFVQLLAVIPPAYINLLPQKLRYLSSSIESPIIDMFPQNVKLDYLYKDILHKCMPLISNVDTNRIHMAIQKAGVKFSANECKLNAIYDDIVI